MDIPRALGILGIEDTQTIFTSDLSPKEELDIAHKSKMKVLLEKKNKELKSIKKKEERAAQRGEKKKRKRYRSRYKKRKNMTIDDEFRILHEAYQYLLWKYDLGQHFDPKLLKNGGNFDY